MSAKAHFVKSARKDNPVAKKGESYWWWKFNFQKQIRYSKERPKPQQLTNNEWEINTLDYADALADLSVDMSPFEDLKSQMEEYRDDLQGRLDNMPEQLQESESGSILTERIEQLDNAIESLETIISNIEEAANELENISF